MRILKVDLGLMRFLYLILYVPMAIADCRDRCLVSFEATKSTERILNSGYWQATKGDMDGFWRL